MAARKFSLAVTIVPSSLNSMTACDRWMAAIWLSNSARRSFSCVMSVAGGELPALVAAYQADRPGVEIHVREGVYASILDDVRSGVADFGISYIDDCIAWALNYRTTYGYTGNPQEKSHSIMMSFGLRTLFESQVSQKADGLPGGF